MHSRCSTDTHGHGSKQPLLAIITTSKFRGRMDRPVSNSWPGGFVQAALSREHRTALQIAMHAQPYTDTRKRGCLLSLPPQSLTLLIRIVEPGPGHQTGPDICCIVAPNWYTCGCTALSGPGAIDRSLPLQPRDAFIYRLS